VSKPFEFPSDLESLDSRPDAEIAAEAIERLISAGIRIRDMHTRADVFLAVSKLCVSLAELQAETDE